MKQINATPAAIAIAMDEMKQALNEAEVPGRTEQMWDESIKDFKSGYIADAVAEIDTPLLKNMWMTGARL